MTRIAIAKSGDARKSSARRKSSSTEKVPRMTRSLGADEVIDYQKQKFEDVLRDYDAVLGPPRAKP